MCREKMYIQIATQYNRWKRQKWTIKLMKKGESRLEKSWQKQEILMNNILRIFRIRKIKVKKQTNINQSQRG